MKARIELGGLELCIDLNTAVPIGLHLDPAGAQPRHFGAPAASARPLSVPGFSGAVADGASCNCEVLTLIPHCNGTHTECVGHLTAERVDACDRVPTGMLPAALLSVQPENAANTTESTDPVPSPSDRLITAAALERNWPKPLPFMPRALVLRTIPNDPGKQTRDYSGFVPPYLTREAAQLIVARQIEHLVVDLPSIDRTHDEGRLTAHRVFFGLPAAATQADTATRAQATVTELAYVPDSLGDGAYLLELQIPAIRGDAVPSRPMLYPLL